MADAENPRDVVNDGELISFAEGRLEDAAAKRVARAVAACPELQHEVRLIRSILESMDEGPLQSPPNYLVERTMAALRRLRATAGHQREDGGVLHLIAQLLYDSRREPALAGMRGGSDRRHMTYGSDLGRLDVRISRTDDGRERIIRGQFVPAPGAFDVVVRQSAMGDAVYRAHSNECGAFRFSVEPGEYDVVLQLGSNVLLVPKLSVR